MALPDIQCSRAMRWSLALVLAGALTCATYSFIGTFVFGLFIYYATRSIYWRIHRRVKPPSLATAVALFALAFPMFGLVVHTATIALREFLWYADRLSMDEVSIDLEAYSTDPTLLEEIAGPQASLEYDFRSVLTPEALDSMFDSLSVAANTFAFLGVSTIHLFVMIAFALYLLRDGHRLRRWGQSMFAGDHDILKTYMCNADRDFNNVFFGNILNAILTDTIGVIAHLLLNVLAPAGVRTPAPALIGLFAGVASLIPVVGMKLVYVPIAGYVGLEAVIANPPGLWFVLLFAAVSFIIVDTIPDLVFRPYVSGRSLHVGAVMLAYTFDPLLFGWYGIFLMSMILVLFVNFARLVLPELLAGKPIRPYMVDPVHLVNGPPVEKLTADEADDTQREPAETERSSEGESDVPEAFTDRDETRSGRDSRSSSDAGVDG